MSALAIEATKRIELLDDENIELVIKYIDTLTTYRNKKKKIIGIAKGTFPTITQEEFDWCNDEIRAMFEDGDI